MSLPNVEWRFVGSLSPNEPSLSIDKMLDKIYELATFSTYNDGTIRTQGTARTGTWSKYQNPETNLTEAVYVYLPNGHAVIIAGSANSVSPAPQMTNPDAYSAGSLIVSLVKNPGSYSLWNDVNPFTTGTNFGYWRFLGYRTNATAALTEYANISLYLYESKESVALFLINTGNLVSNSYSNGFLAGALWDSESANLLDSEEDGRIYGMITSGHYDAVGSPQSNSYIWGQNQFSDDIQRDSSANSIGFIVGHSMDASGPHCGLFTPGSNSIASATLLMYPLEPLGTPSEAQLSTNSLTTRSGAYVRVPLIYRFGAITASTTHFNNVVGKLRNISFCKRGTIGQKHVNGSETVGYVVSCSEILNSDAILLEH